MLPASVCNLAIFTVSCRLYRSRIRYWQESRKVDVVCRLRVTESKANMYANTSHLSLHPSTLFLSTTLLYNAGSDSKFTGLTDDVVVQVIANVAD